MILLRSFIVVTIVVAVVTLRVVVVDEVDDFVSGGHAESLSESREVAEVVLPTDGVGHLDTVLEVGHASEMRVVVDAAAGRLVPVVDDFVEDERPLAGAEDLDRNDTAAPIPNVVLP